MTIVKMVDKIKRFFDQYVKAPSQSADDVSEHSLQIATSALLIEMMRADSDISEDEKKTVKETIQSRFELADTETDAVMQLAEEKIWDSTGYFEFTSLLNKGLSQQQKIKMIEHLWEVAYADSILDKYEEYMVRKIADLIYVSHKDFIDAKLRVKNNLQRSVGG